MRVLIRLAAVCAAFCAFLAAPASAAGRNDIYSVAGVRADASAANAQVARQAAVAAAQRTAFERLVRRVASDQDLARLGIPRVDQPTLDRMVSGIDVADERRSSTRYIANLAVNFDSLAVRAYLQQAGFTLVETRAPGVLLIPLMVNAPPGAGEAWRQAFEQGGFGQELLPVSVASAQSVASLTGQVDWPQVQDAARAAGAATAIFATLRATEGFLVADLVEIGPGTPTRARGQISTPISASEGSFGPGFDRLAAAVVARLQSDWKQSLAGGAGQRTRITIVARYETPAQWAQIKRALTAASSTIVSEVQVDGLAKEGALISFSYVGTRDQLAAEFGRSGVDAVGDGATMILRVRG